MPAAFGVAVAAALLLAVASGSGHAQSEDRPPHLTDLQFGRLLLQAGRLQDAHAFLEQARPTSEDEAIVRLFLLGRIEMRLGLPREAARRFEAILARRPALSRVRLELASAYISDMAPRAPALSEGGAKAPGEPRTRPCEPTCASAT